MTGIALQRTMSNPHIGDATMIMRRENPVEQQGRKSSETRPFYLPAEERIKELTQAILDSTDAGVTGCLRLWAQEIEAQCDLIESMRRKKGEQERREQDQN